MSTLDPETTYQNMVVSGALMSDPAQRQILAKLQALHTALQDYTPPTGGSLLKLFARPIVPPRGLYIWGGVGRGKTMLMDQFYRHAPVGKKRRAHFHSFMLDVHARIHTFRQAHQSSAKSRNPVPVIAKQIASEYTLLCLDELQVTDVADAMILGRLFTTLLQAGVVIVITSNRPPEMLYQGGLQRDRFLKFVELVSQQMEVVELASKEDYRLRQLKALEKVYVFPLGPVTQRFMEEAFQSLTARGVESRTIEVQGRTWAVTASEDVAFFSFPQLCEQPLGAADYLAIAQQFQTVLIQDIPVLTPEKRNEARRFVTLIDTLYDHKVKLICSAATSPDKLYPEGDGHFEFQRTVSRLMEMQSERYLAASHIV